MTTKRLAITLGLAILLGVMTSTIPAATSPGALRVTGPILYESGTRFVVHEGPTVSLPDDRRVDERTPSPYSRRP